MDAHQDARALHDESIVVDLHVDTLLWTRLVGYDPNRVHRRPRWRARPLGGHADTARLVEGGVTSVGLGLVPNPRLERRGGAAVALLHRYLDDLDGWIDGADGRIVRVDVAADIEAAHAAGRTSCFTGLEGAHGLGGDLSYLPGLRERGLRYVGLAHFHENLACHPCGGWGAKEGVGLKPWGRDLFRECERLGLVVDLAHLNRAGLLEACKLATHPVWITHAGVRGVHDTWRNVDDECLRAVADTGGLIGVIFVPFFLQGSITCGLEAVCRHVEHIAKVVGWDHVGLGSDADGFIPTLPKGFRDMADWPRVTAALLERGARPQDVRKALGGNALRVLQDVIG